MATDEHLRLAVDKAPPGQTIETDVPDGPVPTDRVQERADSPHPHRKMIFFICSMALCMASLDATIVATALPRIGTALHARLNWLGWSVTIYQLGQMIAMPLAGKISDQFGRRRIFVICTVLFTATSLACGLSTSIYMLIPLRFAQSLGGGAFLPSASGIVADHFGRDRDRALGMFTSILPIGGTAGPIFGGVIAQYWTWRGIFFINIPIGIVLVILTLRFIPTTPPRDAGRFDFRGAMLIAGTFIAGMLAITMLGEPDMSPFDPRVLLPAFFATGLGWWFIHHIRRSDAPIIAVRLLHGKGFAVMNMMNLMFGAAAQGFSAIVPLYAENRYHIQIASAGTLLSARSVTMIAVATGATMLMRRSGYRAPMAIGFLTIAIGLVFLSISPRGMSPYLWLVLFSSLTGFGMGCASPSTNNATLQLAPDQVGAITGIRGMFRQGGGILYLAISSSLLARSAHPGIYQTHIFLVQAIALTVMAGFVFKVPNHKGRW